METSEFLSLVTPDEGVRFITIIQQKADPKEKKTRVVNLPYHSVEEAVDLIKDIEQKKGYNVYFSCASFKVAEYVDNEGKKKSRTADNALYARALWCDLDVGVNDKGDPKPNAYASKTEAGAAAIDMCQKLGLPLPFIVMSGNGIHVYWPFTRNISKEEWLRIAELAHEVFPKNGLKSDPARSRDIASVLRPIGTYNRGKVRGMTPLPVTALDESVQLVDPDEFVQLLSGKQPEEKPASFIDDVPEHLRGASSSGQALAEKREYPPSHAALVATRCMQIESFSKTGGINYTTWWLGIGLCKYTVEGEAIAHEWSSKHKEYDKEETQKKFNSWEKGPPTCEAFGNEGGLCSNCKYKNKIKTPISLGYDENPPQQEIVLEADEETDEQILEKVTLPEKFVYRGGYIHQLVMVDDKPEYARITKTLFWLEGRHWLSTGEMVYSAVSRVRKGKNGKWQYRRFDLPASTVGKGGTELYGVLGQYEIFTTDGKGAKTRMDSLVAAMAEQLKQRVDEVRAYRYFGWQDDGGFLLGANRISEEKVHAVKVVGDSAPTYLPAFGKNGGDAKEWSNIVEKMYCHPGHAPFQMVVLFGIGSPLLGFYDMPTGCLVNVVGDKGTGKTTAARVGLSAYGDPTMLMTELRSTTELALYNRLATLHSIPCSVDEMTNVEPLRASNMLYSIMNGQPRDGMRSDGKRRDQLVPWATVTFASANGSIVELLSSFKGNASAEMSRLIELDWPNVETIKRREMDSLLLALRPHYGSIGLAFVKWIVDNRKKAVSTLMGMRKFIEDELQIDKENRYWSAHSAVPLATKMILDELGLLPQFDMDELLAMVISTVKEQKSNMTSLTMTNNEAFNTMLTTFSDHIINTRTLKDSRVATPDGVIMNGEPLGRAIVEDNELYLSIPAVREWCSEKRISYKAMRRELVDMKVLLDECRFYLGRGTTRVTGQTYCWRLDLGKVQGYSNATIEPAPGGHLKLVKS